MSLILEALKKSEAKRRLGEAPDLGTPFSAPRRRSKVLPIAAVLIVAAVIWWAVRSPAPTPATPKSTTTSQTPATKAVSPLSALAPTPGQKSGPPLRAVTGANDLQEAPPPANLPKTSQPSAESFVAAGPMNNNPMANGAPRRTPEEVRDRRRGNSDNGSRLPPYAGLGRATARPAAAAPITATPSRPVAATSTPPAAAAKPVATPSSPVGAAPLAHTPDAAPSVPAASSIASAPVQTRAPKTPGTIGLPDPSTAAPASSKPASQSASAPPYSELPFSVRKSLPELRLSMHVYMPDPAQRFVILNDSRITEGDKTTDDVNVREIRPDGVVLEFQGQRFFYPRDGL